MSDKNSQQFDAQLLARLKENNHKSYSILFQTYYKDLVLFAGSIIQDRATCEDIVQNIFLKLWNERDTLTIETSLKSYLIRATRNSCIDHIRHRKIVDTYINEFFSVNNNYTTEEYILHSDLYNHLQEAISRLPEKPREAFILSRFKDMKYKDIAKKLNVAERTIEDRISKALSQLRIELKDFLLFLYLLFLCL
ncbi:MAG: RNA polymerase sigma-70 factor [Dysgonomonas sp.]